MIQPLLDLFSLIAANPPLWWSAAGSYSNVVSTRLPAQIFRDAKTEAREVLGLSDTDGETLLDGARSKCPKCHAPIAWYDNIPLVSWLVLRGKCRHCRAAISIQYPLAEALSASLAIVIAITTPPGLYALCLIGLTAALLSAIVIDLRHMLLPDAIVLPGIWAGLVVAAMGIAPISAEQAVYGAVAGYAAPFLICWSYAKLTGRWGMGHGDFKLAALVGAWAGPLSLPTLAIGSSAAILVVGVIIHAKRDTRMPFGPAIILAGWPLIVFQLSLI